MRYVSNENYCSMYFMNDKTDNQSVVKPYKTIIRYLNKGYPFTKSISLSDKSVNILYDELIYQISNRYMQ